MTNERTMFEKELASLTEPARDEPTIWRAAMERAEWEAASKGVKSDAGSWSIEKVVPLALAAVVVVALSLGLWQALSGNGIPTLNRGNDFYGDYVPKGNQSMPARAQDGRIDQAEPGANMAGGVDAAQEMPTPGERRIVRHVTMVLTVDDVRTAYDSAMNLVRESNGEFVESSALRSEQDRPRAEVKLRIRVDRLLIVLNDLRALGTVDLEQAAGEDVSDQLVDLGARLRNERRIQTELLELLQSREDSPLEDVLKLREQLNQVREQIERLDGQSAHLKQQVALAAIQLTLNPAPIDEEEQSGRDDNAAGLGAFFIGQIGEGWSDGLDAFVRTLGMLVRILIGGLVWWVLLVAVIWLVRHRLAQRAALT